MFKIDQVESRITKSWTVIIKITSEISTSSVYVDGEPFMLIIIIQDLFSTSSLHNALSLDDITI